MPLRLLTYQDVKRLLTMADYIALQEQAFRLLAAGEFASMPNVRFSLSSPGSHFKLMAACRRRDGLATVKAIHRIAALSGRPVVAGAILLFDSHSNEVLAAMDAAHLTAQRTGAVAGLAARYLARPGTEQVAILGAGAVAQAAVEALALTLPDIRHARVYSRTTTGRERFADSASAAVGWSVRPADDPEAAVRGAQIIVCATTSPLPILKKHMLMSGACVLLIGSRSEVDPECLAGMRLIVDSKDAVCEDAPVAALLREASLEIASIHAELADVIAERIPGRISREETVLFISSGLPVQDLVCAEFCYRRAIALGAGILVDFS